MHVPRLIVFKALWAGLLLLIAALPLRLFAQAGMISPNLNLLEGIALQPENVLSYTLVNNSGKTVSTRIKGTISLKNRPARLQYEFTKMLYPGSNTLSEAERRNITWNTNEPALKQLFLAHGRLPQGIFEYCIDLQPLGTGSEQSIPEAESNCIYYTQDDLFSINLVDPEDKATLYEPYPVFSWVASYPFASELTYRIRVAEQKPGQNPANAVARNNPMWQDNQISATTAIYPVTGRPLEYGQPYVWTVDAYYKGLLLGGADIWRFMIVEDTVKEALPRESSYVDINAEEGRNRYYIVGQMKLKYTESDFRQNELKMKIWRGQKNIGKEITWGVNRGDNYHTYDLSSLGLKHKEAFEISIELKHVRYGSSKKSIKAKYVNPEFIQ